jgi:hypothetical protein
MLCCDYFFNVFRTWPSGKKKATTYAINLPYAICAMLSHDMRGEEGGKVGRGEIYERAEKGVEVLGG